MSTTTAFVTVFLEEDEEDYEAAFFKVIERFELKVFLVSFKPESGDSIMHSYQRYFEVKLSPPSLSTSS